MRHTDLTGKIVLITGASSGIGYATALEFAKVGARLLLCARREARLLELAKTLKETYQIDVLTLSLDVSSAEQVSTKLNAIPNDWSDIDILVNNAGMARGRDKLHEGNILDWEEMINTNIKGVLYISRQIVPRMVLRGVGHIINIGSISSHEVYPGGGVYCATKHAVRAISKTLRMELLGTNIRVSSIDPGSVETEFSLVRFRGDTEKASAVYKGMRPLSPEDVADSVLYCATCPPHVNICELRIMPTDQASVGMTHRRKEPEKTPE